MSKPRMRRGRCAAIAASALALLAWAVPAQANTTPVASNGKIAFASDRDAPAPPVLSFRAETAACPSSSIDASRAGLLLGFPGDCWFDIFTMDPNGQNVVNLTKDNGGEESYDDDPSWSPDGRKIAFASTRDCELGDLSCGTSIYVMDADGSHVRRVTDPSEGGMSDSHPTWSPDGTKIAFQRFPALNLGGIFVAGVSQDPPPTIPGVGIFITSSSNDASQSGDDSSQLDTFGDTPMAGPYLNVDLLPAWSPDGSSISFTRLALGPDYAQIPAVTRSLARVADGDSGPAALKSLSDSLQGVPLPPIDTGGLAFSIAGWKVDAAGGSAEPLQPDKIGDTLCSLYGLLNGDQLCQLDSDPAWRPDGRQLAVQRHFIGWDSESETLVNNADIATIDAATGADKDISSGDAEPCGIGSGSPVPLGTSELAQCAGDFKPAYSPDMSRLAFHSDRNDASCINSLGLIPTCDMDLFTMSPADGSSLSGPLAADDAGHVERNADWQPVWNAPATAAAVPACSADGLIAISATASSPGAPGRPTAVHYSVDGGPEQVAAVSGGQAVASVPNGAHSLEFWGENAAGVQEAHHAVSVNVDTVSHCQPVSQGTKVTTQAKPRIAVAGVRRACVSSTFRVRIRVAHTAKIKYVRVYLDGKRILTTRKSRFTIRINAKRLKAGRHRLTTKAYDTAGNVTRSTRRIARCAAAKPKHQTGPRFTG